VIAQDTRWTVTIETWGDGVGSIGDDLLMDLTPMLAAFGAEGVASSLGGLAGGPGATFSLGGTLVVNDEGVSVGDVTHQAVAVFDTACEKLGIVHGGVARVDVMAERYADLELDQPSETYLGVSELAAEIGVSRQRVSELRTRADFPAPVAELAAGPVWAASSLRRFLDTWERKPGRPSRARTTGAGRGAQAKQAATIRDLSA
jgi:hypothetical protein